MSRRLTIVEVLSVAIVGSAIALTAVFGDALPWLQPFSSLLAYLLGKLLGVPIDRIVRDAVQRMPTHKAIEVTVAAVQRMPEARKQEITTEVLEKLALDNARFMRTGQHSKQLTRTTRAILSLLPPETKAKVLETIVFVSSHPPADAADPKETIHHGRKETEASSKANNKA